MQAYHGHLPRQRFCRELRQGARKAVRHRYMHFFSIFGLELRFDSRVSKNVPGVHAWSRDVRIVHARGRKRCCARRIHLERALKYSFKAGESHVCNNLKFAPTRCCLPSHCPPSVPPNDKFRTCAQTLHPRIHHSASINRSQS
jgi:hypothetical protein